jgi:2-keto-4-pentenoate hydratase/2-oxohepta-3-ene-1,7-dioic acid hydratase in catechol pathway
MRLAVFQHQNQARLGALLAPQVGGRAFLVDLLLARRVLRFAPILPASVEALLTAGTGFRKATLELLQMFPLLSDTQLRSLADAGVLLDPATLTLLPPIAKPGKIICVGLNYPFPGEDDQPVQKFPVLFLKPSSTLIGAGGNMILPAASQEIAGEVELAVVIGRKGKHIQANQALDYVAGYTLAIDAGARDWEARTSQWTSGKLGDSFTPLGPFLYTADEIPNPSKLELSLTVNSVLALRGYAGQMIFGIPDLIVYISEITTLMPGDLILTGSPKGNNGHSSGPVILHPGDRVTAAAAELENLVVFVRQED